MSLPPPLRDDLAPRLFVATTILLGIACLIYALTGCAPIDARPAVLASVDGAVVAVAQVYEAEQRACPPEPASSEDACIAAVRAAMGAP